MAKRVLDALKVEDPELTRRADALDAQVREEAAAAAVEGGLFDDLEDGAPPEDAVAPLPHIDSGLSPDERQIFIDLLNSIMPLEERAMQLAKLARFSDTKRAVVGLRALQEINLITRLRADRPTEAAPMFQLPPNTTVQINVTKITEGKK